MKAISVFCAAMVLCGTACGDDDGIAAGSEGGPCYSDGTCDEGLECRSSFCVTAPPCTPESTRPCECAGGETGLQRCGADKTWSLCDCSATRCGNGVLDTGEDCDGNEVNGASCVSEGFGRGTLVCDAACSLDTSGCDPCGNGAIDATEQCDGSDLGGQDCSSQGFHAGTLACDTECVFDTSACTNCGNQTVDPSEQCDGADLDGQSCVSQGYTMGELACDASCALDTTGCITCTENSAGVLQIPLDMIVLLDRSGSMLGSPWTQTVAAFAQFFNQPSSADITAGLNFFPPVTGDQCAAASYNPLQHAMDVLSSNAPTLLSAMNATTPNGVATPTYGGLQGTLEMAMAHKDQYPNHAVIVLLTTDGDPTSCDTSIPNIAALAANAYNFNGVITYGVAIQGANVVNIGTIAQAGGGQVFDVTSDVSLLTQTLEEIRSLATGCELIFPATVPDPALLNINYIPTLGQFERLLQADDLGDCGGDPGWFYDDPVSPTAIHLCPDSCATALADPGAAIEAYVGCPSMHN